MDFDPGEDVDEYSADVGTGMFLTKFSETGAYVGTSTWTSSDGAGYVGGSNEARALALGEDGAVYIGGQFSGTLDFDPGPDRDERSSAAAAGFDGFVTKLADGGDYGWTTTLGGDGAQRARVTALASREAGVVVAGEYDVEAHAALNLPPTSIDEDVTPNLATTDCALATLGATGEAAWAIAWGNHSIDDTCHLASTNVITLASDAKPAADLDPGPDQELLAGAEGPAVVILAPDGTLRSARVGQSEGITRTTAVQSSAQGVYAAGVFYETVDWSTADAPDPRDAVGFYDSYLVALDFDGNTRWSRTWGGESTVTRTAAVAVDDETVVVFGDFSGTVDVNGPQETLRADARRSPFVIAVDHDGNYVWSRTALGHIVARSADLRDGALLLAGAFASDVDLAFGDAPADVWSSPSLYACFLARFPAEPAISTESNEGAPE